MRASLSTGSRKVLAVAVVVAAVLLTSGVHAAPGDTTRISVTSEESQANGSSRLPSMSDDGRFVAFESDATNLSSGTLQRRAQIFVRDVTSGATELVSVSSSGAVGTGPSENPAISGNGRYVAFESDAGNLVPFDLNSKADIFVHDLETRTTVLASIGLSGLPADGASRNVSISDDGRYVAFESEATNLVMADLNRSRDIFVRDLTADTTKRVSVGPGGVEANTSSGDPAISGQGSHVAFQSFASNLVPGDTQNSLDVFIADVQSGATSIISVAYDGSLANAWSRDASISDNGRYVAFDSEANNLVPTDSNGSAHDVFLRDTVAGTTALVSAATDVQSNGHSFTAALSGDGRYLAFMSTATNLVSDDSNAIADVFLRDLQIGTVQRVSISSTGQEANNVPLDADVADGGVAVAFDSNATNLVPDDTNWLLDVFFHEVDLAAFLPSPDPSESPTPEESGPVKASVQRFEVYDETRDGLQTTDPIVGTVRTLANPGGSDRLVIDLRVETAAADCRYRVELVTGSRESNGGLDATGRTGSPRTIGTFTTDAEGDGSFRFDGDPLADNPSAPGNQLRRVYGHLELDPHDQTCTESDGTPVESDEYGAAPLPSLDDPFTWFE